MSLRRYPEANGAKRGFLARAGWAIGLASALALLAWPTARAGTDSLPYDAAADARADLGRALAEAGRTDRRVLLVFGANWCEDCRAFDRALKAPATAALVARRFHVVKVDVGRFDRNLDLAEAYGNPIARGIPAAVVLAADKRVLYATRAGELADARRMGEEGIHRFLDGLAARNRPRH